MSFVTIADRRLEYEEIDGDRALPSLVFLHEGLGSVGLWRDFPARLATAGGRHALTHGRVGHGHSDLPDAPRTPRFMHDEALAVLPAVLDRFELSEPVLVGHSDGGSIALIHAGMASRPVSRMILLAPHVFVEDISIAGIVEAKRRFEQTDLSLRMARHHRDAHATFWAWNDIWLAPEFRAWNIDAALGGVRCPLLVIQGEHDQYGTSAQVDAIERGVPGPVQRVVLQCGHSPHLERPDETHTAALEFLDSEARGHAD